MTDAPVIASDQAAVLELADGRRLAYHASPGAAPGVMFLGGFMSDMTGAKATDLEARCRAAGRAFVRFDYTGHGASSGRFADGTIGRWAADAIAVLDAVAVGRQVLVGSSMGGWIMLLAALARPERVAGLVGVAAAPDFTEDLLDKDFDAEQRAAMARDGYVDIPSDYADEPYRITRALIDDGRDHLLLKAPIPITCPVRLLQGMADDEVPWRTALGLAERLESADVEVQLVKAGDHRLSEPADLDRMWRAVERLCGAVEPGSA